MAALAVLSILWLGGCGKDDDSSGDDGATFLYEDECAADVDYKYNTKNEAEADQAAKYEAVAAYSTAVGENERNKSETGAWSVTVTWSKETLSAKDASMNTVTLEFLDKDGQAATSVSFSKEDNPALIMMDMKMMKVAHSNHLCKMQTDATYTVDGNKLTITNVNFIMASDKTKGSLWYFSNLKATINGTTDTIKRLDIAPDVAMM
jgi:hypothetical protein